MEEGEDGRKLHTFNKHGTLLIPVDSFSVFLVSGVRHHDALTNVQDMLLPLPRVFLM